MKRGPMACADTPVTGLPVRLSRGHLPKDQEVGVPPSHVIFHLFTEYNAPRHRPPGMLVACIRPRCRDDADLRWRDLAEAFFQRIA